MKANLLTNGILLLFIAGISYQCIEDKHHDRYEDPPWLGGTNIETLENEGNYTSFLALMDLAEYRVSIENQLFTIFAPNDSAFNIYLTSIGKSSVNDLSKAEAEELFGQHILINPRSRNQLMYEYAWGELQDPKGEYGTLFHRKATYSVPIEYTEEVRYDELLAGQTVKIYRRNTMIPLFTTEYFEDYFGDTEGSDYLFMYPGSSWSGTQWHEAMVIGKPAGTSSGFIYYVDRVVKPIPTIEKYLHDNQDKFGLFYDLAQRLATYTSFVDENFERMYIKAYDGISNIANEWGPDGGVNYAQNLYMFSSYIPYDNVLQEFLDKTALKDGDPIDSIPDLFLTYLLQSHLNDFLALPSKMRNRFVNYYGDQLSIDVDNDIDNSFMCSNGIVYSMNSIIEPNAFSCVPGPIFYDKNYATFLYALELSDVLTTVTRPDIDVTVFAPTNDELLDYGIRLNENEDGKFMEVQSELIDRWNVMQAIDIERFVEDFIYNGLLEDLNGEGFLRMASDNYTYYNNGQIAGGGNLIEGDIALIGEKVPSEKNGNLFYIDNAIKAPDNAAEVLLSDPDYSSFTELLFQAEMIDSIQSFYEQDGVLQPRVKIINELKQWTIFAPNNQAITDAESEGLIPEDKDELTKFLKYHFVRDQSIFDDGEFSGEVKTAQIDTVIGSDIFYQTLDISNGIENLSVQDLSGNTVSVDHSTANKLMEYGVIQKINSVLNPEP